MGSAARSITTAIALGSLMGCATASSMNTDMEKGPLGSRTQMKTPLNADTGPRVEELEDPNRLLLSSSETYFRIHGRGRSKRLVMDEPGQPLCRRAGDTSAGDCAELNGLAWLDILFARLSAQGVHHEHGIWDAPVDKARKDGRAMWNYCVPILDWKDADVTIATIDALLVEHDVTTDVCITLHGIGRAEEL
ncbi:hypothetical protein JYJ95_01480 [Corallococcus exiguus]|uniref:hypothetical protein n=1 Tax=Corallococcus exiguus TaxID=83462 RepID=UPI001A8D426D|nr:hypothetical protein [Corallococcus exiguus]MBN8465167.1 hypothetical protein [Corallococcus exiguus]